MTQGRAHQPQQRSERRGLDQGAQQEVWARRGPRQQHFAQLQQVLPHPQQQVLGLQAQSPPSLRLYQGTSRPGRDLRDAESFRYLALASGRARLRTLHAAARSRHEGMTCGALLPQCGPDKKEKSTAMHLSTHLGPFPLIRLFRLNQGPVVALDSHLLCKSLLFGGMPLLRCRNATCRVSRRLLRESGFPPGEQLWRGPARNR